MPSQRPHNKKPGKKAGQRSPRKKSNADKSSIQANDLIARMETCQTAEALNDEVIRPFVEALVTVCDARGYVFNIYGDHCNLAITPETHSEALYRLIDSYLDEANL